jgi:transketolase
MYSLPFDNEKLMDLIGANNGYVLSIEDNYGGGLGSAIADAMTESGDAFTLHQLHVRRIPKSAKTPEEMLQMCNITAADIVKAAMKMLQVA